MEMTDRGIGEVLAALETRHLRWVLGDDNLFKRSWPRSTHRQPTPHLLRMFRALELVPALAQDMEDSQAALVTTHHLAVNQAGAHLELVYGVYDKRKPTGSRRAIRR